jgi:hypothetical protein
MGIIATLTINLILDILSPHAGVAELADAHDSKSCSFGNVGSIPTFGISTALGWFFITVSLKKFFAIFPAYI